MQVQNQISTNSILMGGKVIASASVAQSASFFDLLANGLYSNKELAVVREIITNAWDSHKDSGIDNPIEVSIDNKKFIVKDFGKGISPSKMRDIYLAYGISDKVENLSQTGGFGLGCKSPFALVDSFEVISRFEGEENFYIISKNIMTGIPEISHIYSRPTDLSGVEVLVETKSIDYEYMLRSAVKICKLGGIKANINGEFIQPYEFEDFGYVNNSYNYDDMVLRYGNNFYNINIFKIFDDNNIANEISHFYTNGKYYCLMVNIPAGKIFVTPSRESISYDQFTINNLRIILTRIYNEINFNQDKIDRISKRFSPNWEPKELNIGEDMENLIFLRKFKNFKSIRERKFLKRISQYDNYVIDTNNMRISGNIKKTRVYPFAVILSSNKKIGRIDISKFKSNMNVNKIVMIKYKGKPDKIIKDLEKYGIEYVKNIPIKYERKTKLTIKNSYNREFDYDEIENKDFYILPKSKDGLNPYCDKKVFYVNDNVYKSKKWKDIIENHKFDQELIIQNKIKELDSPEFSSLKYIGALREYSGKYNHYSFEWAFDIVVLASQNQELSLKIFGEIIPTLDVDKFRKMLGNYDLFLKTKIEFYVNLPQSKFIKDFLNNVNEFTNAENALKILNLMEKL